MARLLPTMNITTFKRKILPNGYRPAIPFYPPERFENRIEHLPKTRMGFPCPEINGRFLFRLPIGHFLVPLVVVGMKVQENAIAELSTARSTRPSTKRCPSCHRSRLRFFISGVGGSFQTWMPHAISGVMYTAFSSSRLRSTSNRLAVAHAAMGNFLANRSVRGSSSYKQRSSETAILGTSSSRISCPA